jgi:hypothetical protein
MNRKEDRTMRLPSRRAAAAGFGLSLALTLAVSLGPAGPAAAKDLRTMAVRLVPQTDWRPVAGQALAIEVVDAADHEDAAEFAAAFHRELSEQLGKVLEYRVDDGAATRVRFEVQEYDPGNAALRFGVGFGAGKSYVGGAVTVTEGGEEKGSFMFSVRPELPGAAAMARTAAAPLALKLHNGERDAELHPMKERRAKK